MVVITQQRQLKVSYDHLHFLHTVHFVNETPLLKLADVRSRSEHEENAGTVYWFLNPKMKHCISFKETVRKIHFMDSPTELCKIQAARTSSNKQKN